MEIKRFYNLELNNLGKYRFFGTEEWLPSDNKQYKTKYINVRYAKDNLICTISLHKAIALTFIGEIKKGYEVDHIDRNKHNNAVANLRIITMNENRKHRDHTFFKNVNKTKKQIKVTDTNTNEVKYFSSISKCAKHYDISTASIYFCFTGKYKNYNNHLKFEQTNDDNVEYKHEKIFQTPEQRRDKNREKAKKYYQLKKQKNVEIKS